MPVVQNTALNPGGSPLSVNVRIVLVTGGASTPGYVGSSDIAGSYTVPTDQVGAWSATLVGNSLITPANSYYQVYEGSALSNIVVPATGGPYELSALLVTPPPTPAAVGITGVQVAAAGTVEGVRPQVNFIAGTNVTVTAADNPADSRVDVTVSATGGGAGVQLAGDLGGTDDEPEVISTHLADPLPAAQGGTGAGSLAAAGILQASNNLDDLGSATAARTNLGLGTAAVQASTAFDAAGAATTAQSNAETFATGAAGSAQTAAETFATSAVSTETTRAEAAEALLAPLASPALTGSPTAPTKTPLTDSTAIATTAYTDAAVAVETARAETAEASKAPLASPAFTGTPTAPTQTAGDNSTKLATDAFVATAVATETTRAETAEAALLPLAGGTMTGPIAMGASKVTGLANGSASTDAAAFGQIPTSAATIGGLLTANSLSELTGAAGTARGNISAAKSGANSDITSLAGLTTPLPLTEGGTGAASQQAALNALTGTQSAGTYLRSSGTNATLSAIQAGDVPTLNQNTTGTAANVTGTVAVANGGTGQTSAQAALNALAGGATAAEYLRGNGANITLSAIQSSDLPAATGSTQGAVLATQTVVGAPTGVYATDVATINTAISTAGTYGTLYFPYSATAYNVDSLAPLTGQTWYGQATLKRPTASTLSVITATGISGFTMRGLTVDGNSSSSATSNAAVYLINTTWTVLQNVTVQNCPTGNAAIILRGAVRGLVDACQITGVGYGVLVGLNHGDSYSCYGNTIRGCLIDTTVDDAIFISENLGSVGSVSVAGSVIGTVVTGCTVRNFGDCGIEVGSGSLYTQVSGCSFIGISNGSGNNGVLFRDAAHASVTGCTISNLTKAGSTGVYLIDLNGNCSYIDVTDVNIYNTGYGIIAVGGTSPTSMGTAQQNVTIAGGVVNTTQADGVQMTNVAGFAISGLTVIGAGNQGISVGKYNTGGSGSIDGTITGCRVMNSSQATAGSYSGIVLFQASADIAISNCRIGDNQGSHTQGYGIRVYDTTVTNVKIANCDVTNGGTVANLSNASSAANGIEVYSCTGISPVGLRTAITRPDATWDATDHGLIAWSYDAALSGTSNSSPVGGVLYLVGIQARQAFTTSKVYLSWVNGGATPTANENWLGLYNSAGTLVASVEIDSILGNGTTGAGLQTVSWASSYTGAPGQYWIGLLFNAATLPTLYRLGSPTGGATINAGITTAASYRLCTAGTGLTSLANITPSSNSLSAGDTPRAWWCAIG